MTMFTYIRDIPATPNDPSVDQPKMQINNNSIDDILEVDHVSFETANGGTHKKVTYIAKVTPAIPTDPVSIGHTDDGLANVAHPQLYWTNSQGTFPQSAIRAFGSFTTGAADPNLSNYMNVNDPVIGVGTTFTVTLSSSTIVNGDNVVVLLTATNAVIFPSLRYTFTNPTLTLTLNSVSTGTTINFLILQI